MKKLFITLICIVPAVIIMAVPENIVPFIHVDQFGYRSGSKKIAVIGDPVVGYNSEEDFVCTIDDVYELRDWFTDEVVHTQTLFSHNNGQVHEQSGDIVWWFDFSVVNATGSYYVHAVAANVSSGRFEISPCVYSDAMRHAVRALYYQRCGMEKNAQFATSAWADGACHLGTNQDTHCLLAGNPNSDAKDLSGGWHDAGDYNKYVNFALEAVLDLCDAAQINSSIWSDDYGIPESGNGVNDIVDEIKYEIDWLLKMQNADGSVLCMVGEQEYSNASPPSVDALQRVYGPATTASSLSAAAMFAAAAPLFTGSYHDQLVLAAINAWNWADANPLVAFYNSGIIVSGEQQTDDYETAMRKIIVAVNLYDITNDPMYQQFVDDHYLDTHMMQWQFVYQFESAIQTALIKYSLMSGSGSGISEDIQNVYLNAISQFGVEYYPADVYYSDPYSAYMADQDYTWGSNTFKARQAMIMENVLYYGLSFNYDYETVAEGYLHYFHGVNPNGVCFLTNMNAYGAEKSVNSIYHGWFRDGSTLWDEVGISDYGPAPGFIPGGVNPTYTLDNCCSSDCGSLEANAMCNEASVTPPLGQPIQKSWRDWNSDWPQNSWTVTEVGIYTQASYIKLLSHFMGEACSSAIGVDELQSQKVALRLFPNPCNNELMVNTDLLHAGTSSISILDNTGRCILTLNSTARSGKSAQILDTSNLQSGIYFLQVKSGEATRTEKFIILR